MKKFNEVRQTILPEAYKQVEVDWDQDRPDRELSGDIKADFGVYVDGYNKKKGTLKVTGSEKELMNWITDTDDLGLGFDKRTAQDIIKKGKNVKESVEVDEAKAPKMKGVSIKGSEVTGLRAKDGKLYSAKPLISSGKLSYRVEDEFGAFDTIDLKTFAKRFG